MRIEIRRLGTLTVTSVLIALLIMACSPGEEQPLQEEQGEVNPGKEVPDDAQLLTEGKKAWRSCGTCHCAADYRIKEDKDWVLLNEETT